MIPLLPVGGVVDNRFGIMTTPGHYGKAAGIKAGMRWAADTQAFTQGFDPVTFFPWLQSMCLYRGQCLFVPVNDVVGDARKTVRNFNIRCSMFNAWPLAFVAQDGQEDIELPGHGWKCLFVGGSTEWKLSEAAYSVIQHAQRLDKHIHIGRVNWWKRYAHFAGMPGSEEWTCDGTRTRFDGRDRTIEAWADYMVRPVQARFSVPLCDCSGQPIDSMARSVGVPVYSGGANRAGPDSKRPIAGQMEAGNDLENGTIDQFRLLPVLDAEQKRREDRAGLIRRFWRICHW